MTPHNAGTSVGTTTLDSTPGSAQMLPVAMRGQGSLTPALALVEIELLRKDLIPLLMTSSPGPDWKQNLTTLADRLKAATLVNPNETLYFLLHASIHDLQVYSATHSMACAAVGGLIAHWFSWPEHEARILWLAALTMNISMTSLQDRLASQDVGPTNEERELIRNHGEASAALLEAAGFDDTILLQVVKEHHLSSEGENLETLDLALKLREVLRRIDIYLAKLSRRKQRPSTTPALAARDALLGADGVPDALGAALLRVLGLYPPGSWVELANGDVALVVRRGDRAHTPVAAAIRRADGGVYLNPQYRNTARAPFAVTKGLRHTEIRISLNHQKVVSCVELP